MYFLSINKKMQRYTIFFITVNAVSIDSNKEYCIALRLLGYTQKIPDHISDVLNSIFRDILPRLMQSLQTSRCITF